MKTIPVRRNDSPRTLVEKYCKNDAAINYNAMKKLEEFLT